MLWTEIALDIIQGIHISSTVLGSGEKSLLSYPGSVLRLGREKEKRKVTR